MENKKYDFSKLWHRLLDQNMTKRELAKKAEVSVSSLARLKQGTPISYEKMKRIAEVVGCGSVEEIMEEM